MKENDKKTLTKHSRVLSLSRQFDISRAKALEILEQVFADISTAIGQGKHCDFRDFGSFTVSERKPRIGRNPHKPNDIYEIPGRRCVKFRPGKTLREQLATVPEEQTDSDGE